MNLQETIIQLNELKLRGMSSSFEAMTSLSVQNRPSLEVAISKMVDAEVQDRRDRKTAMYLKISKLRYTVVRIHVSELLNGDYYIGKFDTVFVNKKMIEFYKRMIQCHENRIKEKRF